MKRSKANNLYKIFSLLIVIAIMWAIFYLSSQGAESSSQTSSTLTDFINKLFKSNIPDETIRTLAHFSEYCALGFFIHNLLFAFKNKPYPLLSAIFSWAYAWSDEIHQIFVAGRAFQLIDLFVDLLGIILGSLLMLLILKIIKNRKKE